MLKQLPMIAVYLVARLFAQRYRTRRPSLLSHGLQSFWSSSLKDVHRSPRISSSSGEPVS
eukprot:1332057-Alexandrium_andersonii.AAC.1